MLERYGWFCSLGLLALMVWSTPVVRGESILEEGAKVTKHD